MISFVTKSIHIYSIYTIRNPDMVMDLRQCTQDLNDTAANPRELVGLTRGPAFACSFAISARNPGGGRRPGAEPPIGSGPGRPRSPSGPARSQGGPGGSALRATLAGSESSARPQPGRETRTRSAKGWGSSPRSSGAPSGGWGMHKAGMPAEVDKALELMKVYRPHLVSAAKTQA